MHSLTEEQTLLHALAVQYPTIDAAVAESSALRASLSLPKGVVHIVSDVHGDYRKLRHIISNASGSLRPLVTELFKDRLNEKKLWEFLAVLYYPYEAMDYLGIRAADEKRQKEWVKTTLLQQFEIVRALAGTYRRSSITRLFPAECKELFEELLSSQHAGRDTKFAFTMIDAFTSYGRGLHAVRAASHLVRNLTVAELIVAGDLGDRGARIDRVIDYLMVQPRVSFTWGNHDASWMGACLGHEALICTVLRLSLRYRRLSQLEEGYGITMAPLEYLARTVYGSDPAERFRTKGSGLRDDLQMARMQKAIAIMQFKLEAQVIKRHPEWNLDSRNLLHKMNIDDATVEIDGKRYAMEDVVLPTIDPNNPYVLSREEHECIIRLRESFVSSSRLWEHMSFVAARGSMWTVRDRVLIYHGCVPVDAKGNPLGLQVDGAERKGRELLDALHTIVRRAYRKGFNADPADLDWFWYLWAGPLSPVFGKDKMTTFETYFVDDATTHHETKNPYFSLIHDAEFCKRIAADFGVTEDALIVNGHVPVNVEKGEEPIKRGGNAITIDGAFSEAYGDRGYTLVLEPDCITLAEHHHFESVHDAIVSGADIIPSIRTVKKYNKPRTVADTEEGELLRQRITALEKLIRAYEQGVMREGIT